MPATLREIVSAAHKRVAEQRTQAGLGELELRAAEHQPRGFRRRLSERARNGIAIIAELKKASPSKGLIRADFRPADLSRELEQAGAVALSVLTDEAYFQGSLENLERASAASSLPCLRKDFIVDVIQIIEARAHRADAMLLIVAALEQRDLTALVKKARAVGLDVLCEVHDEAELDRAVHAGCDLIGVNSRDLRTFQVDLRTAFRLVEKIPAGCLRVAESGIHSGQDLAALLSAGYDAFLIGESLMKEESPGRALRDLVNAASIAESGSKLEARSS